MLDELVGELPLLRADLSRPEAASIVPCGTVARRMVAACRPHAADGRFVTAMAAVAGSVAEELIAFFDDPRIVRAYGNNGGDIALHLGPGAAFEIGWLADTDAALRQRAGACRQADTTPSRGPSVGHQAGVRALEHVVPLRPVLDEVALGVDDHDGVVPARIDAQLAVRRLVAPPHLHSLGRILA